MNKCKKHEKEIEIENGFYKLTKYLVNRNLNEKLIPQGYSEIYMMSFIYVAYQIPRFKDLLDVLMEAYDHLDDYFRSGKGPGVGVDWEKTFDEDSKQQQNCVFAALSLREDIRIDELFVMNAIYLISQIDDFRDLVKVLAELDKQCGEFEELEECESHKA